jgi:hypothetical protein
MRNLEITCGKINTLDCLKLREGIPASCTIQDIKYKKYVSTTKYIYYHIGVKMDNIFRPSSGHHQVQYKEMWSSTGLRTRMGSHKRSQIPLAPPTDFIPIFLSSGTWTRLFVNANGIPFVWVTLYYSKSCIGPDDGHLMAEKCCPFW